VPRVASPAGTDGAGLTVAQYLAAPAPVAGITPGRLSGTSYARDRSAMVRLSYEFNEHLQLSVKARMGRKNFHDNGQWRSVQNVTIPAGFAGNPFGVPVRLSKVFYDLPPIVSGSKTGDDEFSLTATGSSARLALRGQHRIPAGHEQHDHARPAGRRRSDRHADRARRPIHHQTQCRDRRRSRADLDLCIATPVRPTRRVRSTSFG